ncbi:uncharacterized protein LOC110416408 [Herrania umbratica]|uniref:Uncharacterized protein LOC110416408 n=1 Tax=Herrania umbratica TaxID=108875 RepID=A0A6J1AAB2_9ROSI|nr:uncharacterized protein LOC110416408 [Herrania umbratica]
MGLSKKHSKVLCVSVGAGHEVMALSKMGVEDVTSVEVIESLPLVIRVDPHNCPFLHGPSMLPLLGIWWRLCIPGVDECDDDEEVKEIVKLFRKSKLVGTSNVTLNRRRVTRIMLRTIAFA